MEEVPEIRYAKAGNVEIAYRVLGSGPLDLVWVPGLISNLDIEWEDHVKAPLYRRLAGFSRLITFDKRGMGLSDRSVGAPRTAWTTSARSWTPLVPSALRSSGTPKEA